MRQLIIDTETTGLDPRQGHRIIEFAALELVDRRPTGRDLHLRFDPEREIDAGATEVHGKSWEDLKGEPKFRECAGQIVDFTRGAEWIIHNAPFDIAFLDREFELCELTLCRDVYGGLVDTLALAREAFPGKRNNLDALCERFGVSNAHRTLHGALLDAQLLAEVYLAMTRGQESLTIDMGSAPAAAAATAAGVPAARAPLLVLAPTADELAAHAAYLAALDRESKGRCVWRTAAAAG
ncbi:MAG: DNA polymerase III subunit epsilon [Betaproteobacteria bacterium]|nr:DNA polymerase III subunit epsilon [Betaproteobacteria bacterium]MCC7218834.1 DNA polymerase III subunit epsilon [Burkholderiales bacterium]